MKKFRDITRSVQTSFRKRARKGSERRGIAGTAIVLHCYERRFARSNYIAESQLRLVSAIHRN